MPVGMEAIHPWLCGQVAGMITDILPAKSIVENMVLEAAEMMRTNNARVVFPAKL